MALFPPYIVIHLCLITDADPGFSKEVGAVVVGGGGGVNRNTDVLPRFSAVWG